MSTSSSIQQTTFKDFPYEIQGTILKHLSPVNRIAIDRVCKLWTLLELSIFALDCKEIKNNIHIQKRPDNGMPNFSTAVHNFTNKIINVVSCTKKIFQQLFVLPPKASFYGPMMCECDGPITFEIYDSKNDAGIMSPIFQGAETALGFMEHAIGHRKTVIDNQEKSDDEIILHHMSDNRARKVGVEAPDIIGFDITFIDNQAKEELGEGLNNRVFQSIRQKAKKLLKSSTKVYHSWFGIILSYTGSSTPFHESANHDITFFTNNHSIYSRHALNNAFVRETDAYNLLQYCSVFSPKIQGPYYFQEHQLIEIKLVNYDVEKQLPNLEKFLVYKMTEEEAAKELSNAPIGSYLLRKSKHHDYVTISFKGMNSVQHKSFKARNYGLFYFGSDRVKNRRELLASLNWDN